MGFSAVMFAAAVSLVTPASEMYNWDPQDETRNSYYQTYPWAFQPSPYAQAPTVVPRTREPRSAVGNWTNSPRPLPQRHRCDPRRAGCS
ncbi:hypothetical protein [Rhodoligotrophos ferricapiens]|uniref:hypothetical protein n=1 Tax=Rhodoligotrophos ferricapiens TaxID=3069264 RepID=UPI00315D1AAA